MMQGCKFCDKKGLPVLLVRYAISPEIAKTTPLPKLMQPKLKQDKGGAEGAAAPDMGSTCGYTARILRSGYLYQYDEARKFWKTYFVTQGGFLYELTGDDVDSSLQNIKFKCDINTDGVMASIVTVPDAKKATKVWFAFSPTQWTKATYAEHASEAYRKRHMRVMDVKKWLASQAGTPHQAPINDLGHVVAEYQLDPGQARIGFRWDATFSNRKGHTENLIDACLKLTEGKTYPGAIIALDDPLGIIQDLNALMDGRIRAFNQQPQYERELGLMHAISSIEANVRESAEVGKVKAAENVARATERPELHYPAETPYAQPSPALQAKRDELVEQAVLDRLKPEALTSASDHEWKKYEDELRPNARKNFQDGYWKDFKIFDVAHILPLTKAFQIWIENPITANCFECNHDAKDIHSGMAYLGNALACVSNMQDKGAGFDAIQNLLGADATDHGAFLVRALSLNQEELVKKIEEKAHESLNTFALPVSAITDAYKSSILTPKEMSELQAMTALFIQHTIGPAQKLLDVLLNHTAGAVAIAVEAASLAAWRLLHQFSVVTEMPLRVVTVRGTQSQFVELLVKRLVAASGDKKLSNSMLRSAVRERMLVLKVKGFRADKNTQKIMKWVTLEDVSLVDGLRLQGLTPQQRASALTDKIHTADEMMEVTTDRAAEFMHGGGRLAVIGTVSSVLQYFMNRKLISDCATAMQNDVKQAFARLWGGYITSIAFAGDMLEKALDSLIELGLKRGVGIFKCAKFLGKWVGKTCASVAGAIFAVADFFMAWDSFKEKNYGLMGLFLISSIAGAVMTMAFLLAWVGIGWIALAVLLLVSAIIELVKDNNIQNWLKRTLWGRLPEEQYSNEVEEMNQLKIALG